MTSHTMTHTPTRFKTIPKQSEPDTSYLYCEGYQNNQHKPSICLGLMDKEFADYIVECCNGYEALKAQRDDLFELLVNALPFVEESMTDQGYKAGAVEKYTESIRSVIAKVEALKKAGV